MSLSSGRKWCGNQTEQNKERGFERVWVGVCFMWSRGSGEAPPEKVTFELRQKNLEA